MKFIDATHKPRPCKARQLTLTDLANENFKHEYAEIPCSMDVGDWLVVYGDKEVIRFYFNDVFHDTFDLYGVNSHV